MKMFLYACVMLVLAGCSAENNLKGLDLDILNEERVLQQFNNKIDSLDNKRIAKRTSGKFDAATDSVTKVYIKRLKDSVNARLNYFNAIAGSQKSGKSRKQALLYLSTVKQNYAKELKNILFLDDLFKASTFNRINTAAFFERGEYTLNDSAIAQAVRVMQAIIKDAHDFSSRHADRKLKAMFVVVGYADELIVSRGSDLYNELAPASGSKAPDQKHLNTELSNRRASSIKNILKNQYREFYPDAEKYMLSSSFISIGKGQTLPEGTIKNYLAVDERRRVVLIFWSILPDLE